MTLQPSSASVTRLKHIRQNVELAKLVRTMVWDITFGRVGARVRDWHEWESHCKSQAQATDPVQSTLYRELAASRRHWEAYLSRLADEKKAEEEFGELFGEIRGTGFELPNLQKIHMVKGAWQTSNQDSRTIAEHATIPVTVPLSAWKGDSFSSGWSGNFYTKMIVAIALNVKSWQFDGFFVEDKDLLLPTGFPCPSEKTTSSFSMTIRPGVRDASQNLHRAWPPQFLVRWRCLESIHIDLGGRMVGANNLTASMRTIQDTFEVCRNTNNSEILASWPKLRKLSLGRFDSTPSALLSLISRHRSTLRDLRLHAIWLQAEGSASSTEYSWRELFKNIGSITDLENIKLTGEFRDTSTRNDVWDFDNKDLAMAMATWMIDGGDCPLANED